MEMINGIHHITSLTGSARNNIRFYNDILGLKLLKKTVNFERTDVWHLYYGDKTGNPASIVSFYAYTDITRGKPGNKSVSSIMYSVGSESMEFWIKRLKSHQIEFKGPFPRFNHDMYIHFEDFDGIHSEIVATNNDIRTGYSRAGIPVEHAIKGIYGVSISYASAEVTSEFLRKHLGHVLKSASNERIRLFSGDDKPGNYIDLLSRSSVPDQTPGTGTIHHLSFSVPLEADLETVRTYLARLSISTSPVLDRNYFKSIQFREPGGVRIELSTPQPQFTKDETEISLGKNLQLPQWLDNQRESIERSLSRL